jgi:hypothetical protein
LVRRIEEISNRPEDLPAGFHVNDFVGGGGGVICCADDLHTRLPPGSEYEEAREVLRRVGERAAGAIVERKIGPNEPLGFAHGAAGDLWALMAVRGVADDVVRGRLQELARLREVDADGLVYWRASRSSEDHSLLGTWCTGMAGHSLLWTEVVRRSRTNASAQLARSSAETCSVLLGLNPTLCCGLAGQAVALQRFADVSGESQFARRAYARLARAIQMTESPPGPSLLSLWTGTLGLALVALLRLHGEAHFPCIERIQPILG